MLQVSGIIYLFLSFPGNNNYSIVHFRMQIIILFPLSLSNTKVNMSWSTEVSLKDGSLSHSSCSCHSVFIFLEEDPVLVYRVMFLKLVCNLFLDSSCLHVNHLRYILSRHSGLTLVVTSMSSSFFPLMRSPPPASWQVWILSQRRPS